MRRVFVSTALSVGVVQLLAACTLTSDPFKPASLVGGLGNDAGERPAIPEASPTPDAGIATGSSCGGSSEQLGGNLPLAPLGACQSDLDCTGQVCAMGRCAAPSCSDGGCASQGCDGGSCQEPSACANGGDCQTGVCAASGCSEGVERCCQPPSSCTDEIRNGTESDVDCGGGCALCAPGLGCDTDADCESAVCQEGRCCGGRELDCTRCARRLASILTCELSTDPVARDDCNAFLDCLASNPALCSVRHAAGCSDDPGGVCNHTSFGGNGGPGLVLADNILGTATCFF